MKTVYRIISFAGLIVMFGSSILVFNDAMRAETYHAAALIGTAMWFVPVPFWMKRRLHASE